MINGLAKALDRPNRVRNLPARMRAGMPVLVFACFITWSFRYRKHIILTPNPALHDTPISLMCSWRIIFVLHRPLWQQ